jgi:hypothetical protein
MGSMDAKVLLLIALLAPILMLAAGILRVGKATDPAWSRRVIGYRHRLRPANSGD